MKMNALFTVIFAVSLFHCSNTSVEIRLWDNSQNVSQKVRERAVLKSKHIFKKSKGIQRHVLHLHDVSNLWTKQSGARPLQYPHRWFLLGKSKSTAVHRYKDFNEMKQRNGIYFEALNHVRYTSHALSARKRRNLDFDIDELKCNSIRVSCKGRCLTEQDAGGMQKRCSCDPYCDYFKDCCADYIQYCLREQSENITDHEEKRKHQKTMKEPDEQWTCRSGIWMIASCPQNWTNQEVNQSCLNSTMSMNADNYKYILPVVTADNKTYANRFCAHCHGKNSQTLVGLYEISFECLVRPPSQATKREKIIFLFKFCEPSLKLSKDISRRHCFESVEKCPANGSSIEELKTKCLKGNYGLVSIVGKKLMFKNVYCARCNNYWFFLKCGPVRIGLRRTPLRSKSFSVIMDIGGKSSQLQKSSEILSCPKGKVYDVYLEVCRKGVSHIPVMSNQNIYSIAMWMKSKKGYFLNTLNRSEFSKDFASAIGFNVSGMIFSLQSNDLPSSMIKIHFNISLTNRTNKYEPNTNNNMAFLFETFKPFQSLLIGRYCFIIVKVTAKPQTCIQTETYSPHEYQVIPDKLGSVYVNKTGEVLGVRDYFPNNLTVYSGSQVSVGEIVVCRPVISLKCSGMFIFLQKHDFVIFPNRSVLYNASGRLYGHGTYLWRNGTIMICTNITARKSWLPADSEDKVLIILTYVGFSLSLLCLLFVLVTFSFFTELRTFPGINLMNLCSALLVAQLLWLLGSGLTFIRFGCMVIAIVLHYFFLASFWWMSIIAFDTWKAFSGRPCKCRNRRGKQQKKNHILRTMAVGWLPLLIYVAICVALDRSGTVAIGYGGEKGCWINDTWANLFFFAIPIALSVLWNAVFFLLIIKEIQKTRNQSKIATSTSQRGEARKDVTIYGRIAVLMGFTWLFGFIVPFTSHYLMYPFVVLNTLQGLYIAVAFGFTRRVRVMYKNIGSNTKKNKRPKTSVEETRL